MTVKTVKFNCKWISFESAAFQGTSDKGNVHSFKTLKLFPRKLSRTTALILQLLPTKTVLIESKWISLLLLFIQCRIHFQGNRDQFNDIKPTLEVLEKCIIEGRCHKTIDRQKILASIFEKTQFKFRYKEEDFKELIGNCAEEISKYTKKQQNKA